MELAVNQENRVLMQQNYFTMLYIYLTQPNHYRYVFQPLFLSALWRLCLFMDVS